MAPGMDIGYVVKDAKKWEVDPERTARSSMPGTIEDCWRRLGQRSHLCFVDKLILNL